MTETRAEKARRLCDEGRVTLWRAKGFGMRADVVDESHVYVVVLLPNDAFRCPCEWDRMKAHTTDLCAHALAVKLAVEKEKET